MKKVDPVFKPGIMPGSMLLNSGDYNLDGSHETGGFDGDMPLDGDESKSAPEVGIAGTIIK